MKCAGGIESQKAKCKRQNAKVKGLCYAPFIDLQLTAMQPVPMLKKWVLLQVRVTKSHQAFNPPGPTRCNAQPELSVGLSFSEEL
jgi:hypothetical protein